MKIKAYKKDFDYTYTLGVFETIELLKNRPDLVLRVYIKSNSYKNKGIPIIDEICREKHIELIESDNTIQKLSKKDNCFAIAIIKKYEMTLQEGNHVVLVNPGDMGNMGTIMRTMLGFNYYNLAIIRPGVDVFDPRVLRASMGAMFHLNIEYFDSFEDYLKKDEKHNITRVAFDGKYAKLDYMALDYQEGKTLVKINLVTGRSHQIRVQFSSRNLPLWGDQKYNTKALVGEQIALWAYEIRFEHPISKEVLEFRLQPKNEYPWNIYKGE